MSSVSRRALLRGVAGGAAARLLSRSAVPAVGVGVTATGCTPQNPVQVVVVWSGTELEVFRGALKGFEHADDVELISAGDGIGALLRSRIEAGYPPDVAVLPSPGLLKELLDDYSDALVPLGEIVKGNRPGAWLNLPHEPYSRYGVWVKVTHKSVFWCREEFIADGTPTTLPELVNKLTAFANQGRRPLSIGAADGWVLTDWFENALLAVDSRTYRDLAVKPQDPVTAANLWASSSVAEALRWLGRIWGIPKVFADGPERAVITQYDEAALRTFVEHRGDAAVTFGGDYTDVLLSPYRGEKLMRRQPRLFRFPAAGVDRPVPLLVAGDAAVLLRPPGGAVHSKARKLVSWLAGKGASRALASGGFLTVHADLVQRKARPSVMSATQWQLIRQLVDGSPEFDLSDRLGGGLARSDGLGLGGILQDFFTAVAECGDGSFDGGRVVCDAVENTHNAIIDAAGKR